MKRIAVAAIAALVVFGCTDQPAPSAPGQAMAFDVSDGAHAGNAHFFFLPPLVTQPTFSGEFNPSLKPLVEICHLTADPTCQSFTTRFDPSQIQVDPINEQYHVNWNTSPSVLVSSDTYRVRAIIGNIATTSSGSACPTVSGFPADQPGCKELGFRDVIPVATPQEVPKDQSEAFYVFLNGSTNPIKFRIEKGALCAPGVTDCGEGAVDSQGGTLQARFSNLLVPTGALTGEVTVVIQKLPCTAGGRVQFVPADLPQFEGCYDYRTFPEGIQFSQNYVVGMCVKEPTGLSIAQENALQIHKFEPDDPGAGVQALLEATPPTLDCTDFDLAEAGAIPTWNLARRGWRALERGLGSWLNPPAVYAAHTKGGSGSTLSHLVWALPAQMAKLQGDNQTTLVNTAVAVPPAVVVTDPNGPVQGATVHFTPSAGSTVTLPPNAVPCLSDQSLMCAPTDAQGKAQVASWTLGPTAGTYTLVASGVGLGSTPTTSGVLPTGSVTFTATACKPGFGTPQAIDGVINNGEWACAQHADFTAKLSGGSGTPATLFWMNDGTKLYLAVRVQRSSADKVNTLQFNFDNNNSANTSNTGVAETGDDILIQDGATGFSDNYLTSKCTNSSQSSCGVTDLSAGGTKDGLGAYKNQGGYTMYELAHPLNSGDTGRDFALSLGGRVGLFLTLQLGSGAQGNTQWPGFRRYLTINIEQP